MRVLGLTHVFPRTATDPCAPFLLAWARGLQAMGTEVVVMAPHDAGLPARHVVAGVPVRRVRYGPDRLERLAYRGEMHELVRSPVGPALLAGLVGGTAAAVRALVRAGRPDVLHVHWWVPGAVVARLARPGVPVVLTVHGTDVALLESRPALAALARWALAGVDRVEAVSADLAERLEAATGRAADAVGAMPLTAVPAAPGAGAGSAGPEPGSAVAGRALRVLGAGRMVRDKGFADLVDALARLDRPATLTLLGDGPEQAALADRARGLGVPLEAPGRVAPAALAAAYRAADVVVQPSHREGFGLVAAEAAAAGVPVVATDSGGVRDVLGPEELVAVGDVPGLAAALERVAADLPAARARAADRAATLRARLDPAAVAARTLDGYRALVTPEGAAARVPGTGTALP